MANKFRALQALDPASAQAPQKPVQMGMDGGFRGDVSPRQMAPNQSPELDDIRFERSAIRRDFGWTQIGAVAASTVLGILEHKFIDANQSFRRLIRLTRNGSGNAVLEAWDGASWTTLNTSSETIQDLYLSMVSAQGCVYIADGTQILEWCEVQTKIPQEDDFPNGNSLTTAGQQTDATIDPGSSEVLDYTVTYRLTVNSSSGQDTTIVLQFLDGSTVLGEKTHVVSQFETFPFTLNDQEFNFTRQVSLSDVISIRVKSATGGGTTGELDNVITPGGGGGAPDVIGDKTPQTQPAVDDNYRYFFNMSAVGGGTTVGFYYWDGSVWQQAATKLVTVNGQDDQIVNIPGLINADAQFGMSIESGPGNIGDTQVGWTRSNADFSVHGHNAGTQGDDPAGVTYETTGAVVSQFQRVDPGPGARFLLHFARRLIALRDGGDTQVLAWSVDGILTDFTGVGSGSSPLVESRSDPIDQLTGAAVLSSNFVALFRQRSIMRVFETGNEALAIGAVSWIEDLGTNSPFSIRNVRGGVLFLGHDNMVYFLTEGGPVSVGEPIHQNLIETLTENQDLVDSGWDPSFGEYYLGVPELGATEIDQVWIFDVDRWVNRQEKIWRKRPMAVQRFASAGVSLVD